MRTSGNAAWSRPLCRIVHGLVIGNMAVFVAAQACVQFAWGQRDPISMPWCVLSMGLMFAHILAFFVWAWIDGEPVLRGGGFSGSETDDGGSGDDGGSSDP